MKERQGPEAPAREVPGPCDHTLAGERAHTSREVIGVPNVIAGRTEQRSSKDAGRSEGEALSPC